jgi:serine/threonine protein kinase
MVFELLGPSLEDLFNYCGRQISLKTVLMIADQLICRLQFIHLKNMIHRDIKPENFLMGTGRNGNCIHVTDLGLATEYRPNRAPQTIPSNAHLLGTAVFASVTGHRGVGEFPCHLALLMADREAEQSRRDDLESLGYILLYFLRGRLPWANLEAETKAQKYELMMEMKKNIDVDELCDQVPREFADYMDHVRALTFEDKPNYSYLRRDFRELFIRRRFEYDNVFDWTIKRYMEQQETQCGG